MSRLLNAKAIDILSKPVDEAAKPPSYLDWCKQTSPEMSWDWDHTKYIADALDDVYAGKCKRLLISMPPQFGKSSCVTHRFPLYMMRYKPGSRIGLGSYNATYAKRLSRQAKRVAVQSGLKLGDKESAEEWELVNGSNMYAVGMGGGVTGRSIDCLVGDTLIHTETGMLRIDELVNMKERPRVLSYNHDEGRLEYKAVLKAKVTYAERLCELGDGTGRLIRCTGNHRIFTTESGYQEASSIATGKHFLTLSCQASLPTLPEQDGQRQSDVSAVLLQNAKYSCRSDVYDMCSRVSKETLRSDEGDSEQPKGHLLLSEVRGGIAQKTESVQGLRKHGCHHIRQVLRRMPCQVACKTSNFDAESMLGLQQCVSASFIDNQVLRKRMRRQSTLRSYDWDGELALQRRRQLQQVLRRDAEADFRERRSSLRVLRSGGRVQGCHDQRQTANTNNACGASYRRSDSKQQPVQLDHSLPRVSPDPSSNTLEAKPVCVVRQLHTVRVPVYDITVEGNSNFFANEILVHNCWIIDDPVKSREEADSPTIRDKCWEWYLDDVTSRLQEGSPLILIMTRWHMDDLAGRILNSEDSPNWRYLRLPAIAEEDDPLGRPVGAPLCPERFSLETLLDRQKQSPETFEALYQQNPVARGGSFFRREWFEIVDKPFAERYRRIRYWDLAYTKKETSAWTAGVLMSTDGVRYCVEHVERFRETPAERNERIRATLAHDVTLKGFERAYFEDQPAAGVEVAQNLVASCAGMPIQSSQIKGDKAIRAIPFADAARAGLVKIVRGPWTETFLNELTAFPRGATKDQVDSASSAFTRLTQRGPGIVI